MIKLLVGALVVITSVSPETAAAEAVRERAALAAAPVVDHHFHLTSPVIATLINGVPLPTVALPQELASLVEARAAAWGDAGDLERLFTSDALVLVDDQQKAALVRGRSAVANFLAGRFAGPYQMVAVGYSIGDTVGQVTGYYVRPQASGLRYVGAFQLGLTKDAAGLWQIKSEMPAFPGSPPQQPVVARDAVAMLNAAGVERAVVLSTAGAFGGKYFDPVGQYEDPMLRYQRVKAENDWTLEQTAQFPDRLIPFCSLNPLEPYAMEELRRCASTGHRGLKMQFFESAVDLRNPQHVSRVREIFSLSNSLRLPIVVHVANNEGPAAVVAANMTTFLDTIVAAAPDVTVQIAHLWGGSGYSAPALRTLADAVSARHPATRNMYFDVAEAALVASGSGEMKQRILDDVAARIRQIGTDRILFGSDQFGGNHLVPKEAWEMFRSQVPLSDAEFDAIAGNVAPYVRTER